MADLYFDEKIETLPREQLRKVQDHRLRWQFRRCWDGSEWYRTRFEAAGLSPETFGGLADLERISLLDKTQLAATGYEQWGVCPYEWLVLIIEHEGEAKRSFTRGDIIHLRDRAARSRWAAGAWQPNFWGRDALLTSDMVLAAPEASVAWLQSDSRRHGPHNLDTPQQFPLRPLDAPFVGYDLAFECFTRNGRHWGDDHLLAEIIDPKTGIGVPNGKVGELVVTDLVREANPLVRYRTGLKRIVTHTDCACGRTSSLIWTADQFRKAKQA